MITTKRAKSGIKIMKLFEIRRIELISSVFHHLFLLGAPHHAKKRLVIKIS